MRAVIFDMDGVLIDSMKYHIYSWSKAFEVLGLKTTKKEILLFEGMSSKKTINMILKKNNITLTNNEKNKLQTNRKEILNKTFKFVIYEEVLEILYFLKSKNIRLGLVTGSNREFTNKIIEKYFKNLFDVIITGDDIKNGKPNSKPYEKAKQKFDFKDSDFLVIENAPLGIESAKKAKLKVIALKTTLNKNYLEKADLILKNHRELLNYFKNEFQYKISTKK